MDESINRKKKEEREEYLTQAVERFWEAVPAVWCKGPNYLVGDV